MNLQVLQEDLNKALTTSIRFVNSRSTLPILNNFLLVAQKTKLEIEATNLEMSISLNLGAKIEEEGSVTVPAKTFQEIIGNLNQGPITLALEKDLLKITSSSFTGSIPTIPANDFPKVPKDINKEKSFALEKDILIKSLSKVLFSSSLDETRPVLNGVLFVFKEGSLDLVSSDGFRLSKKSVTLPKKIASKNIIIPRNSLIELAKILGSASDTNFAFEVKEADNQLVAKIGDIFLSTRLIEGAFPDFQKIIPAATATKVSVDKKEFERGVRLASVFAQSEGNVVRFTIDESNVSVNSESAKAGSQKNQVDAKVEGPTLAISFNFKYVEDFISACGGESVELRLVDPISPGIFVDPSDTDFLHIIMPVRIQN